MKVSILLIKYVWQFKTWVNHLVILGKVGYQLFAPPPSTTTTLWGECQEFLNPPGNIHIYRQINLAANYTDGFYQKKGPCV